MTTTNMPDTSDYALPDERCISHGHEYNTAADGVELLYTQWVRASPTSKVYLYSERFYKTGNGNLFTALTYYVDKSVRSSHIVHFEPVRAEESRFKAQRYFEDRCPPHVLKRIFEVEPA